MAEMGSDTGMTIAIEATVGLRRRIDEKTAAEIRQALSRAVESVFDGVIGNDAVDRVQLDFRTASSAQEPPAQGLGG